MNAREALFDIRGKLLAGILTYDQAKIAAAPYIESMNAQAKIIAKRHGKKFYSFTFSNMMR